MKNPIAIGIFWIVLYLIVILLPLVVLLFYSPTANSGRTFWLDFSVALGFIGLAMMAMQFALTARTRLIEASYGIDLILQFHRYTSVISFLFILLYPIILFTLQLCITQ